MLDFNRLTISQALRKAAEERNDRGALAGAGQKYTWRELYLNACRVAQGLAEIGVKRGDKVATIFGTTPEWIIIKYAVHILGGVLVPINANFRAKEIHYLLKQADVKIFVFTDILPSGNYIKLLEEIDPLIFAGGQKKTSKVLPELNKLICYSPKGNQYGNCSDYNDIFEMGRNFDKNFIENQVNKGMPHDICNILFTSGSTAFPKGAMHTHQSLLGIGAHLLVKSLDMTLESRMICYFPFYHIAGCIYHTLGSLTSGSFLYALDFDPQMVMTIIQEEKINYFAGFDAHFNALTTHPDFAKYDLSTVDRVILATGPVWYDKCKEIFPSARIIAHHYGFTEGTGVSVMPEITDEDKRKNTNGKPWPGVEIKVVDPGSNTPVPVNTPGELCLRGWPLFQGYYNNPEETEKAFDDEGYFHTGDYGWQDEEGFVVYRGRFKMMIKTGGENVSEREVEVFIETLPEIKSVQVIGIPDEKWGEAVTAVVEVTEDSDLTVNRIIDYCQGNLAGFKIPKKIFFFRDNEWPLLGAGKVDKQKLKRMVMEKMNANRESDGL